VLTESTTDLSLSYEEGGLTPTDSIQRLPPTEGLRPAPPERLARFAHEPVMPSDP
jgi:hypothetical protein